MAIIKTYPLKSNYYGLDRLILSDMQPDAQGVVHGETKSLTLASLKSFIGTGSDAFSLETAGSSGPATFNTNTKILNIPDYSVNNVDGSGTANYMAKWIDSNTIGIGAIYDNAGNVGIGTTNPTADGLEVATKAGTTGGNTQLFITGNTSGRSVLGLGDGANRFVQHILTDHTQNIMSFHTAAASVTNNERMRITSTGNVGIGTTAPTRKLEVNGDFSARNIESIGNNTGVTFPAVLGWYRIMEWGGASRGGTVIKLSTTGGDVAPTTYVINAYKTYDTGSSPAATNTLKLEQYGNSGYITKARIATDSVTNTTYLEVYLNALGSGSSAVPMMLFHDSLLGYDNNTVAYSGTVTIAPATSVSQEELPFVYEGTTTEKSSSELVTLIGDGTNDGKLRFNCSANSHYVEIEGPTHSGGSSYSLKLPNSLPSVSNQILETNALGVLTWIPTPTGGGGGGGTLNTVGLTMPSAFSVGNSPLTGTGGTISVTTTGGSTGEYLDYQGSWSTPTNTTYSVMGSGNSYAAGLVLAGSSTHASNFLRKDGTWATPAGSYTSWILKSDDNTTRTIANGSVVNVAGGTGITTATSNPAGNDFVVSAGLDLATSSTRGGIKIGYTESGKNYPVELSNEQAYVNVPWTDTNTTNITLTTSGTSGAATWNGTTLNIPQYSSGGSGGIGWSGSTADGLATYSNSTTAKVNSAVRLTSTGFMTFDGSSEGAGVNYYSTQSASILRVGDMSGDSAATVELWTSGNRQFEIGVNGEIGLGTGASQGTSGQVLTSQGNGSPAIWSSNSSSQNIANTNLTQTANRTYAMGTYALTMTGSSTIQMQNTNGLVVNGNIISNSQSYAAKNSISNQNSNFTINCNDGNVQQVVLTNGSGNVVISFSNIRAGARYTVITTRLGFEGTYGTYSFNSVLWPNDSAPQNVPAGNGTFNMYEFVATTTAASGMLGYFFRNYQTAF
jgi:hypothetical protein